MCFFAGHDDLCEQLWAGVDAAVVPIRRFLEEARSLFPALTMPFLRLLAALTSGSCAAAASDYLQEMLVITCRSAESALLVAGILCARIFQYHYSVR